MSYNLTTDILNILHKNRLKMKTALKNPSKNDNEVATVDKQPGFEIDYLSLQRMACDFDQAKKILALLPC